jgi:excinuclease ABC subunit A
MEEYIYIKGAKENNLKNIDLKIPRNKLIVFTGVSGSGKTSLAFDTIFAEGQRRYVESLSSYARQFLGQMQKPDVESIDGLSPAISIDQKTTNRNPRSTVGTVTEIYDYLRLLFARAGTVFCPNCGKEITQQTVDQIADQIMALGQGSRVLINSPVVRGRKGEFSKQLEGYKKSGFARVSIDGSVFSLDEEIKLDKNVKHNVSVVVDRLILKEDIAKRLYDSIETALNLSGGLVIAQTESSELLFNTKYACTDCNISLLEIEPRLFSFNSPFGACEECSGLGFKQEIAPELIYGDGKKTLREGALNLSGWSLDFGSINYLYIEAMSKRYGFSLDTPYKDLSENVKNMLLYGNNGEKLNMEYNRYNFSGSYSSSFEGIVRNLERRYRETSSDSVKRQIEQYMKTSPCKTCGGLRLKKEALAVRVMGYNIAQICAFPVGKLYEIVQQMDLGSSKNIIAAPIKTELLARLKFLKDVGLDYLTLSRGASTLSGGEAQRIRLATQIGSGLMGVLYILDEPSIGLQQRDNQKLIATLEKLRDLGKTWIVVEHDEDTIRSADHIVDIGPGAGVHGGRLVAQGSVQDIMAESSSISGKYLSGERRVEVPAVRRKSDRYIEIVGAAQNNLKNIDVKIPLNVFTVVTGVSGSGKSSLINQILYPAASNFVSDTTLNVGKHKRIDGLMLIDKVIAIDQSPIGRTPRSNPATYTGVFTHIRELFAKTQDAQERGYKAGRFSFNAKGGRCEHCGGAGILCIEMNFLPDVYVPCEVCHGKRYNRETLAVKYKGKSISDVLDMTAAEAVGFFENIPSIYNKIKVLYDVGLGYIKLGQSATTLSGGEAQRVKLATELSRRATSHSLYILDEPTTGLHIADVEKLLAILQVLVGNGNTVVVIEHNLDVIKTADYVIDLGPEGGDRGGKVIFAGTPEEIAACKNSHTGQFLLPHLGGKI